MSQLVKTKRQANFKGFKRFGAFKGLVEQKTLYSTRSCVNWPTHAKKGPIYTQTHQINYYFVKVGNTLRYSHVKNKLLPRIRTFREITFFMLCVTRIFK
jgi:hypothetical protein